MGMEHTVKCFMPCAVIDGKNHRELLLHRWRGSRSKRLPDDANFPARGQPCVKEEEIAGALEAEAGQILATDLGA